MIRLSLKKCYGNESMSVKTPQKSADEMVKHSLKTNGRHELANLISYLLYFGKPKFVRKFSYEQNRIKPQLYTCINEKIIDSYEYENPIKF